MSKYTTEVRYICENYAGETESQGYDSVQTILDNSWDKVFDFDFPIFDEEYREPLCKKILKHYYTREICEETVGLWKLRLDARMNEIMPYFNQLYNSELVSIAPLVNYRVSTMGNKTKTGVDSVNETGNTNQTDTINGSIVRTGGYSDTKSGNNTLEKQGKEANTKSGNIDRQKTGVINEAKTGQGNKVEEYNGQGGTTSDVNVDLFTDTPQGNIANMGDDYGSAQNPSDVPIVGDDTSYLTTAEKTLNTHTDNANWKRTNGFDEDYLESKTTNYGLVDPDTGDVTPMSEKEVFNNVKNETEFTNRKDVTTYGTTEGRIYNQMTDTENKSVQKYGQRGNNKSMTYGTTNTYVDNVVGSKGKSDSALLKEFRETFLNIDEMIIGRLKDLFILLW